MRYRRPILVTAWLVGMLHAQTLVDLRTQSKSVDFSGADTTKPFKSGTVLPATCSVGEAFFQTNAPAGLNLYACTAVNSWTLISAGILTGDVTGTPTATTVVQIQGRPVSAAAPSSGQSLAWSNSTNSWTPQTVAGSQGPQGPAGPTGPQGPAGTNGAIAHIQNSGSNLPVEPSLNFSGGGCTDDPTNSRTDCTGSAGIAGLTIALNGTTQGTQATLNFISGTGIVQSCTNNTGASRVDCTPSFNTALIPTHDTIHADENYCASSNGTTVYTCSMPDKALTAYTLGQMLLLNVDTTCASSCSLNIDGVGAVSIKKKDGMTDPGGALVAGQAQLVWYDGSVIRLMYF
ncbi:MAG TPA: collagen-like protein [Bryobacteraceae bacterium]|nr:collagen-like protein [Bryobacteraceae bacterium]